MDSHPGLFPWRTHAALAHHRAGRPREARELADSALALARAYQAPTATGIALRTLGQLTGDLDALAEAAGILAGTQTRLEHARALVELGASLRRANHRAQAREPLRDGLDLVIRLGATALGRQAVDELAATGARPAACAAPAWRPSPPASAGLPDWPPKGTPTATSHRPCS
jgi:hypothetical protein